MAATLPERIALARREQLDYGRSSSATRSTAALHRGLQGAGFQEICRRTRRLSITMDRRVGRRLLPGIPGKAPCLAPAGVGKTGPGIRRRQGGAHRPLQPRRRLLQDGPSQGGFAGAHFPVLSDTRSAHRDDLGLHRLTAQQSADLYELILQHRASSLGHHQQSCRDLGLFETPFETAPWTGWPTATRSKASYQRSVAHRALLGAGRGLTGTPQPDNTQITMPQGGSMTV